MENTGCINWNCESTTALHKYNCYKSWISDFQECNTILMTVFLKQPTWCNYAAQRVRQKIDRTAELLYFLVCVTSVLQEAVLELQHCSAWSRCEEHLDSAKLADGAWAFWIRAYWSESIFHTNNNTEQVESCVGVYISLNINLGESWLLLNNRKEVKKNNKIWFSGFQKSVKTRLK